jgi:hypothetical protein
MMDSQSIYGPLRKNLEAGNVVAFVGAGMSVGAGLPGWYRIIEELCQDIGYSLPLPNHTTSETLINAAQYFVNKENLHALITFLKEHLDTSDKEPTTAHLALARLPITTVFTANYDDLLERGFRKAGKRVNLIVKDESLPFLSRNPNVVNLIKLYGDLEQPETIVLAREQYDSFFLDRPQMVKLLENELTRSDMLYLGWSHSDPHFNLVFGEILTRFKKFLRTGYAVMFDVPENERLELDRKNIHTVELPSVGDRTTQLTKWLDELR